MLPYENWQSEDEHLSHEDEYACMAVQRLVSGLPTDVERERHFVVLQVCIDDSGTGRGSQRWFILAGYIARVQNWKGLSDDWQAVLRGPPKLDYIKAQEACHGSDQFERLTWPERDVRMLACKALIERYVKNRVSFTVRYDEYDRAYRAATAMYGVQAEEFRNPYTFALGAIVAQVIGDRLAVGQPKTREKIEFIFDCGFEQREQLEIGYRRMIDTVRKNLPKPICDLIASEPLFRPDHEFLPLQPADIAAWGTRRMRNKMSLPRWYPLLGDRENVDIEYDEQDLRDVFLRKSLPELMKDWLAK